MAFDQNSIPKDLRPINVARSLAEESRVTASPATVAGRTAEGFYAPSVPEGGSPQSSVQVFYPAAVSDPGFGGLGYVNSPPNVAAWYPNAAIPYANMSMNPPVRIGYSPNLVGAVGFGGVNAVDLTGYTSDRIGTIGGNAGDQTSGSSAIGMNSSGNLGGTDNGCSEEQSAHDLISTSTQKSSHKNLGSVSGAVQYSVDGGEGSKKVKFLCSFGGKILPRPSDGMLRYVGGQTRIVSIKKDICFNELVQKVMDIYGQPVIIKYQLPDEDLDALVSVSCPDDLDNMMEEYEKLSERCLDGSNKLRIFLFSGSELDSTGMVQFGDLNNSGQRYVEAVNGMMDSMGPCIARKESIASAASTQNSELSGHEPLENLVCGQSDTAGPPSSSMLSPGGNLAASSVTTKTFFVDPNPPMAGNSNSNAGFPAVNCSLQQAPSSQPEDERHMSALDSSPPRPVGYDLPPAVSGVGHPSASSYEPAYVDAHAETINLAASIPPQANFSNPHLIGTAAPIFAPQQYHAAVAGPNPHHFISPVHMTMVPATAPQVGMRPTRIQQGQLEQERSSGPRVFLVPIDQTQNPYHLQAPGAVVGGGYGWNQVVASGPVVFSEGSTTSQPSNQSESITKFEDCYMCQKALPHAHSDTVVQDQKTGTTSTTPLSTSIFHSLRLEDNMKPQKLDGTVLARAIGNGFFEPVSVIQPRVNGQGEVPSEALEALTRPPAQKAENFEQRKLISTFPGNEPSSDVVHVDGIPRAFPESCIQRQFVPTQSELKQEAMVSRPRNFDAALTGGLPAPRAEQWRHESPKEYSKLLDINSRPHYVNSGDMETVRRMETQQMTSPEMIANAAIEDGQLPGDEHRMAEMSKQNLLGNTIEEMPVNNSYAKHDMFPASGQMLPIDFANFPVGNASCLHDNKPLEFFNSVQPLNTDVPRSNFQTKMGVRLEAEELLHNANSMASAVGPGLTIETVPSSVSWITDHSTNGASEGSTLQIGGQNEAVVEDPSKSLFMNRDSWNLNEGAHLPPPKPTKIALRREPLGNKDALLENRQRNVGEFNNGAQLKDGLQQQFHDYAKINVGLSCFAEVEEKIKQDLQDVAEGITASILESGLPSNTDLSVSQENKSSFDDSRGKGMNDSEERHYGTDHEDDNPRVSERKKFGFPESDRIGRLQIIRNSDLEELRELGSGTYGTVYHGKWRGTDVAIKRINDRCFSGKPSEQDRMRNDFWNEAINLADLHHPNVVAFYGIVLDGPGGSFATVTEYMVNGSLRTALQKNEKNLDERKRLLIAMNVAFGMEYLHGKSIVHFDLKSDNLLVNLRDTHRPICKVGDLGLSKVKCQTLISGGVRGTLPWMAPELLNGSSSLVSEKVDVFSFGIVMWELLTGDEPYADLHYGAIIGGIVSNTLRPPVPDSCDPKWRSLMERCWSSEPSERPNFTEIADALRSLATKNPTKAQNSSEAPSKPEY
ncbi:hypothetical protein MLD38_014444 [Melastoma candidum]|uniref:Uncharacterized protein n=1 Tax=Melastoma candidum TaxID=119954 RepID=A0ACB9RGI7_9MYRT|nr:hypothetical protein MLD38_014444 [Melastoma candidum]